MENQRRRCDVIWIAAIMLFMKRFRSDTYSLIFFDAIRSYRWRLLMNSLFSCRFGFTAKMSTLLLLVSTVPNIAFCAEYGKAKEFSIHFESIYTKPLVQSSQFDHAYANTTKFSGPQKIDFDTVPKKQPSGFNIAGGFKWDTKGIINEGLYGNVFVKTKTDDLEPAGKEYETREVTAWDATSWAHSRVAGEFQGPGGGLYNYKLRQAVHGFAYADRGKDVESS